jgi:hypothetical protein
MPERAYGFLCARLPVPFAAMIAGMRRNYPRTLGSTDRADLLLRTWCNRCRHWGDIDPGEQAERHGADLPLLEWRLRLVCPQCGSHAMDCVAGPRRTGGLNY